MMNFKQIIPFLGTLMLLFCLSNSVSAQLEAEEQAQVGFANACDACRTSVSGINAFNFPQNCLLKGFGAVSGGWGRCTTVGYVWATSDPMCNIQNNGSLNQFPLITFSGPGKYQVCVIKKDWYDANGNGIQDAGEICSSDQFCIWVDVCP